jgi:molybdopterin converting factor subunit 1
VVDLGLTVRVKLLYFGQARDAAGVKEETLAVPDNSQVGAVVKRSMEAHTTLRRLEGRMRIAVNEEFAPDDTDLEEGDVVAFLPPVAGG